VFNLNRLVYTEDIVPRVGGETLVVPGSHRRGVIPPGPVDEDFADQVVLTPRTGSLLLLHGHTWHRVRPVKGHHRVSTNYRCSPAGTPENITDICVYRNMRYRFETSEVVEVRQ
jgi:ectoine hydroxylase-related dioxygenase (phytanoyl-CoA dioxygenase family)